MRLYLVFWLAVAVVGLLKIATYEDAKVSRPLVLLFVGIVGLGVTWTIWRALTARLTLRVDGLELRNRLRTHVMPRASIEAFVPTSSVMRPGGCGMSLRDGRTIVIAAIEPKDLEDRDKVLDELNAWLR